MIVRSSLLFVSYDVVNYYVTLGTFKFENRLLGDNIIIKFENRPLGDNKIMAHNRVHLYPNITQIINL